jgi:uroporphyrinogen decarboxylase
MNHRERVLTALRHEEPDRVPIDFGGTVDSSIMAVGYQDLRTHLNLNPSRTKVSDVYQQTAIIEDDARQALDVDTAPVLYEPEDWREGRLSDQTPALFPARFQPTQEDDGSHVVRDESGTAVLKMPKNGFYFDSIHVPLAKATTQKDIDDCLDQIESYDRPDHLDRSYEDLAQKAEGLRQTTDYCLVGFFGGHIFQASQTLRGWEPFLVDLIENQKFAEALMDRLTEVNIRRFERYARTIGPHVDVIHFEDDLGMQDRPLISPALYRKMVKPYQRKLFEFAKSRCQAFLLYHTDGAVAPLIADFIEMGVDALNPVQVSAEGMETRTLKKEFGQDITFWGAGCESQTILPSGTLQEISDEVKRRLDDLAPGGGFVFSPIHNIQAGVAPENIITMFKTAREYGVY